MAHLAGGKLSFLKISLRFPIRVVSRYKGVGWLLKGQKWPGSFVVKFKIGCVVKFKIGCELPTSESQPPLATYPPQK